MEIDPAGPAGHQETEGEQQEAKAGTLITHPGFTSYGEGLDDKDARDGIWILTLFGFDHMYSLALHTGYILISHHKSSNAPHAYASSPGKGHLVAFESRRGGI